MKTLGVISVDVTVQERGDDYVETLFELSDGRVLVTNSGGNWAGMFASRAAWEHAETPYDALEEYDSITDAFLAIV